MAEERIRDRNQRTMGYIVSEFRGRQRGLNSHRRTLGYYDADRDVTMDAGQRIIARGNVLASLIFNAA